MGANAVTTVPVYVAGEVLTAADLNITNSGIPVFASTVERDAAFGGTGEKVLAEGQFAYLETGNVTQYYDGAAWQPVAGGKVAQVVTATKTDTFTTTSATFVDITGLTVSITPSSATSKVFVVASVSGANNSGVSVGGVTLARGGTNIFGGASPGTRNAGEQMAPAFADAMVTNGLSVLDSPATTSATTYSVQAINGPGGGTFYINRSQTDTNSGSFFRAASSITVMEILA
jgi:hypothetical protein